MKKPVIILLVFFSLLSCSTGKKVTNENHAQKWILSKMTGQMLNSETIGKDMAWQEFYLLESDGTFTKQRIQEGVQSEGTGVYSYVVREDGKYLELVYKTESKIIGSCTTDKTEILWIRDNRLLGTWLACDGPGLEYKHVK